MAWETLKQALLDDLAGIVVKRADAEHRDDLTLLSDTFFSRFSAEDMRDRSPDNLYGMLYGLMRFMQSWAGDAPKVRLLNPQISTHGWESTSTIVAVLCRDMPFCTASVRGEINQRNLGIHCLASCNLRVARAKNGELQGLLGSEQTAADASAESLLYFEITRHSDLSELDELRESLEQILEEVAMVVGDFGAMRERLDEARECIAEAACVSDEFRDEAAAFIEWLRGDHMTFLGYEYLRVEEGEVHVDSSCNLGVLRGLETRGAADLEHDLAWMAPEEFHRRQLSFGKSRRRAKVHRQAYPDYVEVKTYDASGAVTGQHRFLGHYTAAVYNMDPAEIPILRRKVSQVLGLSGLAEEEHDGRELKRVLELMPRDELFQSSTADLYNTTSAVNRIQERRHTRLFVRKDAHGKFISCLLYMPRDRYTTQRRMNIQRILTKAFSAEESEFNTQFTESVLVRVYFVLRVDPSQNHEFDVNEIEEQIVQATLAWKDRLRLRLLEEFGEERGEQLMRELGDGFAPGYRDDFDPRVAVLDIQHILALNGTDRLGMNLYRLLEEKDDHLKLRLYRMGSPLPLSDVLPILENLGLRVVAERAYPVRAASEGRYWIQEFSLIYSLAKNIDLEQVKEEFEDAFSRIWYGQAESDSFNRLLLGSRLSWREIALLRAYACYFGQINFAYSRSYIAETMAAHLPISSSIVELFLTRFSPVFDGDDEWRDQREAAVKERILLALDEVENLGQDRIIRQYVELISATVRTNFFQQGELGDSKSYFSFKLRPGDIPDIPRPVPLFEIFVYSPQVEGVHLRGGKVARGGLRWSDRLEDFRTEVLGLVKAQQVKNAVIVPVGAKGGFVAKRLRPDMTRDEAQEEGVACYKTFIRGLLDITDNREEDRIVRPQLTVCKDDEDPYLVVAADKGTATFSDIANSLSEEYGFWLGDAFASGGSVGYDHKKMGITARGAWVSVERHFREMGVNVATTEFSVVGIGDMSGDVFGNGMLLSKHIALLAAFNHMHIFVDPNPDAERSYLERERLFALPRSGWSDYDTSLISEGGGVFSRNAKSVAISEPMKARFGITVNHMTPTELISAILRSEVDLLWNGGIGTYVKSSSETHTDVGDKANDGLRVNARDLRCKVIGEGGNLGITQLARTEFALIGGRSNTDFIDNAAGVDCSDHEVNIKILLDAIVARGDLTEKHRNQLLEDMTESVSALVLANNYRQVQAISIAEREARVRSGEYRRLISTLENAGRLDRELEFLPTDEALADRRTQDLGLTRPELSVLISYSKAILKEELIASDLGSDAHLLQAVSTAFPAKLKETYPEDLAEHRLRREIMCTQVANDIVNRMGLNFVLRQQKATGAPVADVARAYTAVMEIFGISTLWDSIEALDFTVVSDVQIEMMLDVIRLVKRATRWVLRNRRHQITPTSMIEEFCTGVTELQRALPELLRGRAAEQYEARLQSYNEAGVNAQTAARVAGCMHAATALAIVDVSTQTENDLMEVATLYYHLGERLELDWFGAQVLGSKVENEWQAMAREAYMEDLQWQQCTLAQGVLRLRNDDRDVVACITAWEEQESALLKRWKDMLSELHTTSSPDFAMFAVANRELLDLAQSSRRV
ncbi:NAD-glutamate dehydrogenase [Congregibacter sp.]|uniref:NAD-glutamate dehydrogenase n=1 Tax=Congregibacter sp. TaxID=2744308 RepID=UPI003859DEAE